MSEVRDSTAPLSSGVHVDPGPAVRPQVSRRPWHGRMLEDAAIEMSTFRPGARVFAIASAGCTAMSLARRGDRVTAVDVHPGQIELARRRIAGSPVARSRTELWLEEGRRQLVPAVWRPDDVATFLRMVDTHAQVRFWRERLSTRRFHAVVRAAIGRPRAAGERAGFPVGRSPDRLWERIIGRLETCIARHPNRWNPFLWWLLVGEDAPGTRTARPIAGTPIRLEVGEACHWLETHPDDRFDGFTLSNLLDGAPRAYRRRLIEAVRRTASPDAVVILRSLDVPPDPCAAWLAARDRSGIWGSVEIVPVSRFTA